MANEPRDVGPEEARTKGVSTGHSEMPNGELRFRLKHVDGTAYSRTEASASGGWQNSHYHRTVRETYIVQRGRMAFAELVDGDLKVRIFGPNEICTTEPNVSHNVYLFRNSVSTPSSTARPAITPIGTPAQRSMRRRAIWTRRKSCAWLGNRLRTN
jgi:mannose-6-phosphate isomerase-like protein (cupin superfamily)